MLTTKAKTYTSLLLLLIPTPPTPIPVPCTLYQNQFGYEVAFIKPRYFIFAVQRLFLRLKNISFFDKKCLFFD